MLCCAVLCAVLCCAARAAPVHSVLCVLLLFAAGLSPRRASSNPPPDALRAPKKNQQRRNTPPTRNNNNTDKWGDAEAWHAQFGDAAPGVAQVRALQAALAPVLLRRMKEDVEDLPEKEEVRCCVVLLCGLCVGCVRAAVCCVL